MNALWESEGFRRVAGHAWRPGGLDLTARGLVLCQELCGLSPGHLVADLGCGPGGTVRLLQQAGYDVFGLDRQVGSAAAGGSELAQAPEKNGQSWGFAQADIARLPLADACVQGLVCECVLSLLADPVQVLRGFLRVLRPGGVLLFSDLTRRDEEAPLASGIARTPGLSAASASPGAYGAHDVYGKSCMDGARSASLWDAYLCKAGFRLVHYEDHSRALVELAARMLWYGEDEPACMPVSGASSVPPVPPVSPAPPVPPAPPGGCTCSLSGNTRKFGYGLWIAQKEHA